MKGIDYLTFIIIVIFVAWYILNHVLKGSL